MIDLEDLQKLVICKKCNVVYMPEMSEPDYFGEQYPKNDRLCGNCTKDYNEKKDANSELHNE